MHHYKTEVALYENGSFIADWSMPVFERLLKAPQQFELKRFRIAGIRSGCACTTFAAAQPTSGNRKARSVDGGHAAYTFYCSTPEVHFGNTRIK